MELTVGVDVATAAVRAVAVDAAGRLRATARTPLPEPVSPHPGRWEQDPSSWWPATAAVLRDLSGQLDPARDRLQALAVCATSGTVVALDEALDPIGPGLTYADQRAVREAEIAQDVGASRWTRAGLRVQASFGLAKWAWLLRQPGAATSTARLAHASDVIVTRLIGEPATTDWSHALKSGYDVQRDEWASEVLDALGIPVRLLPDVRRPTSLAGKVSPEAAAATGLPRGCDVRLGMTDACASQVAAGASTPGRFVSVLGSTLVLKGVSRQLVADPAGTIYSHRHPDGWWLPGGASSTGARALTVGFPGRDLAELDRLAACHGPARGIVYPLVGRGERFPFAAPDASGFTLGLIGGEVERYRATLEGVAFLERLGYERLAALGAAADPPIAVTGGGSASRVWTRIRAAVLGIPVLEKPDATTALGAAILAAAGTLYPDLATATDAMAATGDQVDPDGGDQAPLEDSYHRFTAALEERGWLQPL